MGRKGKTKKDTSTSTNGAQPDPAPADLLGEVNGLIDQFQLEEAQKAALDGLQQIPNSRKLSDLNDVAAEMASFFKAEGVCAELGVSTSSCSSGSRGRGLTVTRSFKQGETIVIESPLLVTSTKIVNLGCVESADAFDAPVVEQAWRGLSEAQKRLISCFETGMDSLPRGIAQFIETSEDQSASALVRFARVMKLNAHDFPEDGKAALYVLIARANHSCDPSCALGQLSGGRLYFYALRDMEAGEEVDYSYLGAQFTLQPSAKRREQILKSKLFHCLCSRCQAPEQMRQVPCAVTECFGFMQHADGDDSSNADWRCCTCGAEEVDASDRLARYQRLEPMISSKLAALEAKWNDPAKDVTKYISDWEALAKSSGQMLGLRHYAHARACYFALQALNTGKSLGIGGVDAKRHTQGVNLFGFPLIRYLKQCCSRGARCVLLEPVSAALVLLSKDAGQGTLVATLVQEAGHDELRLPLFDKAGNDVLMKIIDSIELPQ